MWFRERSALWVTVLAVALILSVGALAASVASAANARIGISNYAWSRGDIQVDRGEHVTWYWVGPDLMHSVTGQPPNALQWDSDAGIGQPMHPLGDSWSVTFDTPGTYVFQCKLHSSVRGTVTVSNSPGNPGLEPDPVPALQVDTSRPVVSDLRLERRTFKRRTVLSFALDKRGTMDTDYYRLIRRPVRGSGAKKGRLAQGKGKRRARIVRRYAGYKEWPVFIGFNRLSFGQRWKHFRARPGRYEAVLRVTDTSNNTSKVRRLRFQIRP